MKEGQEWVKEGQDSSTSHQIPLTCQLPVIDISEPCPSTSPQRLCYEVLPRCCAGKGPEDTQGPHELCFLLQLQPSVQPDSVGIGECQDGEEGCSHHTTHPTPPLP